MMSQAARRRVASGVAAAIAALGLVALEPVGPARAGGTVDQITGSGVTDSAVTVRWDKGLLGLDNTTVVKPRDSSDPYAFMHDDFKNLEVTVGQTESLVHQAIKVSWKGGKQTSGAFRANYMQIMECYGDANAGPDPENCQFGSPGLKQDQTGGTYIGSRGGGVCKGHTPSTTAPLGRLDGGPAFLGCDPAEDPSVPGYSHYCSACGSANAYKVPFIAAGTTKKLYQELDFPFRASNSNEVQEASTRADGTGEVYFNAFTSTESPGLGCGDVMSDLKARGCWLVIVPRGEWEPNGWKLGGTDSQAILHESPLGAGTWAQRIQVHLGYNPVQPACRIGEARERPTQGTELVSRAVYSWQLALNSRTDCKMIFGYTPSSEGSNTAEMTSPLSNKGLAFTTVPIGSEVARDGGLPPAAPPIAYAPIAVSATAFGFNINGPNGNITTPVRMTPRLAAKALTQSYKNELTDSLSSGGAGPAWARANPGDISFDKEFIKLNPGVGTKTGTQIASPLLVAEHSGVVRQIWAWILADKAARDWLAGNADEYGMVINPAYRDLNLAAKPLDNYPRVASCYNTGDLGEPPAGRCTLDLLPYMENLDEGASRVSAAINPHGAQWDLNAKSPSGGAGWWAVAHPVEFPGQVFMYGLMDTASAANYGVVQAQLCKADGTGCVGPSEASVTAALGGAEADASGLLQVNPATAGANAYPLVTVTYAAVRKEQDATALAEYSTLIKFAATDGQTPGVNPGQLPHGFLPLPQNLRDASTAIAAQLLLPPTSPATTTAGSAGGGGTNTNTGGGSTASSVPNTGARPVAASSSAAPFTTTTASPVPAALNTPPLAIGAVRWALIVVVIAGLAGAVGGPLLRFALSRRMPP